MNDNLFVALLVVVLMTEHIEIATVGKAHLVDVAALAVFKGHFIVNCLFCVVQIVDHDNVIAKRIRIEWPSKICPILPVIDSSFRRLENPIILMNFPTYEFFAINDAN